MSGELTSEIIVILFTQVVLFGLTVTAWADMLTSEIIVILFTDTAREIITCQATYTQIPGFAGEVLNPRPFPGFLLV